MYAVIIRNVQRNQWPTIQTSFNLHKDCAKFFIGELHIGDDMLEMCLSVLDCCFPQSTKMWGMFRYELPFVLLGGAKFGDNPLSFLVVQRVP